MGLQSLTKAQKNDMMKSKQTDSYYMTRIKVIQLLIVPLKFIKPYIVYRGNAIKNKTV